MTEPSYTCPLRQVTCKMPIVHCHEKLRNLSRGCAYLWLYRTSAGDSCRLNGMGGLHFLNLTWKLDGFLRENNLWRKIGLEICYNFQSTLIFFCWTFVIILLPKWRNRLRKITWFIQCHSPPLSQRKSPSYYFIFFQCCSLNWGPHAC
jgi:hypothetical protein